MIKNERRGSAERLSDTALVLLSQAANRKDGIVLPPPASVRVRGGALEKVLGKLLRQGFVEEVPASAPAQAWRSGEEGSRVALKIAAAGLKAIGVPVVEEPQDVASNPPQAEANGRRGKQPARAASSADQAAATASPRLDAADVKPASKQAILIEQLSRPSGAGITDLVGLLGWQPHTVRAALTGLRRTGYTITRSRNEQDETVYRAGPQNAKASNTKAVERA